MATTTRLQDYIGRWLGNATPGTSDATDHLGRGVTAGDKDFVGRGLTFTNPALWVATTTYAAGDRVRLSGGAILEAAEAGTSGATAPTAPAVGGTVVDGTVTWQRLK